MNTRQFPHSANYASSIKRSRPTFWTPVRIALCITYAVAFIALGVVL